MRLDRAPILLTVSVSGVSVVATILTVLHRLRSPAMPPVVAVVALVVGSVLATTACARLWLVAPSGAGHGTVALLTLSIGAVLGGIGQALLFHQVLWSYSYHAPIDEAARFVWACAMATPQLAAAIAVWCTRHALAARDDPGLDEPLQ